MQISTLQLTTPDILDTWNSSDLTKGHSKGIKCFFILTTQTENVKIFMRPEHNLKRYQEKLITDFHKLINYLIFVLKENET